MIELAIGLLWFCIGVIILGTIVFVVLWVIKLFIGIPPKIEQAVWAVVGILVLIFLLTTITGGGFHPPLIR